MAPLLTSPPTAHTLRLWRTRGSTGGISQRLSLRRSTTYLWLVHSGIWTADAVTALRQTGLVTTNKGDRSQAQRWLVFASESLHTIDRSSKAMDVRYAAISQTGMNDATKELHAVDDKAASWATFSDAKAAVVLKAQTLRDFLDESHCPYRVQSFSSSMRYEVWFEYGPHFDDRVLPFRMVLAVRPQIGLRNSGAEVAGAADRSTPARQARP